MGLVLLRKGGGGIDNQHVIDGRRRRRRRRRGANAMTRSDLQEPDYKKIKVIKLLAPPALWAIKNNKSPSSSLGLFAFRALFRDLHCRSIKCLFRVQEHQVPLPRPTLQEHQVPRTYSELPISYNTL
jgi:hypothetical protein